MIIVIDSSVWISALQFDGTPWFAIQKALNSGQFAVCDQIVDEIIRTLTEKMRWELKRIREDLASHFKDAVRVVIYGNIREVCRDPHDDAIIECAVNSHANLIISGDKDLLVLEKYKSIRIVTPAQYIATADNGENL